MAQIAYYRLCDWAAAAGPVEDWLAAWKRAGWVPRLPPPYENVDVTVDGSRRVTRWGMVRAGTFADTWADQRAALEAADPGPAQVPLDSAMSLPGPSTDQHERTLTPTDSGDESPGQGPEGPS